MIDLTPNQWRILLGAVNNTYYPITPEDVKDLKEIQNTLIPCFHKTKMTYDEFLDILYEYKSGSKETFDKRIFLGSGEHSIAWTNLLHRRLEYAIMRLGGMQQNGGMGSEYRPEEDEEDKKEMVGGALGLTIDDIK